MPSPDFHKEIPITRAKSDIPNGNEQDDGHNVGNSRGMIRKSLKGIIGVNS
jgi:hypothetical protein